MKFPVALIVALIASASAASARVDLLLVPPVAAVPPSREFELTLYLNNPTSRDDEITLPSPLAADYATLDGHHHATLVLADSLGPHRVVPAMTRAEVKLRVTEPLLGESGFISLRLTEPETNAVMFEFAPAASGIANASGTTQPATANASATSIKPGQHLDLTSDLEGTRRHISSYDPIYFAVGSRERLNARFQFSFKFRLFEPSPADSPWPDQLMRDIYLAYTQTTIWDLETFSKPFYDSSYRPTAFLLHEFRIPALPDTRLSLQLGVQHESNGRGGGTAPATPGTGLGSPTTSLRHPSDSRSVNSLYFAPKVRWTADNDLFVEVTARASAYFQTDENPDIARYRGHIELTLRSGYDRGFQLSAHVRGDPRAHGSVDFNATWPAIETPFLKMILPASLGGYAQIQYFNGYGESLLDYDVRRKDQLRFGLTLVR